MVTSVIRTAGEVKYRSKEDLAREEFFNQPDGFPFDGFRIEDVNLPPEEEKAALQVDDAEEVAQDVAANVETGFGTSIGIDGLPIASAEKFDKLETVIRKKFEAHGHIKAGCLWMPKDEEAGKTKGYAFIEYSKGQEAMAACREMDHFPFDKSHTLRVYRIDELDRLTTVPEEYTQPEKAKLDELSHVETMAWMMDKRGRDQFLVQHAQQQAVCWNDPKKRQAEEFFSRTSWSDRPMSWSPLGTYVATLHHQGVALWTSKADNSFERASRFPCVGVQKVDFSAGEEFITCYSVVQQRNAPPDVVMTVYDCRSGRKLRQMQECLPRLLVGRMRININQIVEPFLSWSPVAPALAAKLAPDSVQIYTGADMTLLDKKSLPLEGVQDICWSPQDNSLAVYQMEHGNLPARVAIIALPDRTELRQKNLFAVHSAKLYWHPNGTYLAVHVEKHTKSKKSTYATIELFSLKNLSNITNDVLELPNKNEKVLQVAWEPTGDRFAVIHSEQMGRVSVSFYSMLEKSIKESARLLGTINNRPVTSCHWSPAGRNVVLAALDGNAGNLEFFNVDDMATLRTQQHFLCNNIKWDQTGRFVCSWVDDNRDMEHGYVMWSFTGEMLYRNRYNTFFDFAWRPRPPCQLQPETERQIMKNLRTYAKRYDEQDEQLMAAADTEQMRARQRKRMEWEAFLEAKEEWEKEQQAALEQFLGHPLVDPPSTLAEINVQHIIDVKAEPYQ
jgi:translation initiation factor 3 subunit B